MTELNEPSGQHINLNGIHTSVTLFSQRVSFRLVLSYVKEGAGELDFCDGHSPAVTVTFVCPSERREVSDLPVRVFPAARARVGRRGERVSGWRGPAGRGQEMGSREWRRWRNCREDVLPG